MSRRVPRGLFHVTWIACALLALRPVPAADRAVEFVLAPSRVVGRVFTPLTTLGQGSVSADERDVRAIAAEAYGTRVLEDLVFASLPSEELRAGRRCVPARVLRRPSGRRDELVVEPWTLVGVEVGQPVVFGDSYVGRVHEILGREGRAVVRLVTQPQLFVGALLPAQLPGTVDTEAAADAPSGAGVPGQKESFDVRFVVGGVAVGRRPLDGGEALLWLAAHNPSRPDATPGGLLVVDELLSELDPFADLSRGFELGRLERGASDGDWHVAPQVDFLHGLYQVVVVTPPGAPTVQPPAHPLFEPRWARARAASAGDPNPTRAGAALWVDGGASAPLGAAVVAGGRLVGRVTGSTVLGVDVALLADPGLALPVSGVPVEIETPYGEWVPPHDDAPRVLGRIVSLGLDRATGQVAFHLRDAVPLELAGLPDGTRVRLRLVTGSGETALPSALVVGEAVLLTGSSGGRGRRFLLDAPTDPLRGAASLFVRLADDDVGEVAATDAARGRIEAR
ncbi:Cell shape-determining protein MreC [Planctomycetes bacterium Pla163]|uniref:Cell shape-determining protein MreC n=1 Tax=Rohdeia mirabilis TaxID=2528008 RepID=A0A518D3A1_9BACT|nr:Cell shape-determining protein MreC [Planctomycetes bacterium Pla163]